MSPPVISAKRTALIFYKQDRTDFFFLKKLKYEGLPIFMITKPILLVSPKPAFFLALRIMASE